MIDMPPSTSRTTTISLPFHCCAANMTEQNIRTLYSSAELQRKIIESSYDSNTDTYQQNLAAAIATYEDCLKLADRISLFSPNESLEDLASGDLQYDYHPYQNAGANNPTGISSSTTASQSSSSGWRTRTGRTYLQEHEKLTNATLICWTSTKYSHRPRRSYTKIISSLLQPLRQSPQPIPTRAEGQK